MDGWSELACATTAAGDALVLRERAGVVELRCNGWELMSNRAHHSEEALAALALQHIERRRGGGAAPADTGASASAPDAQTGVPAARRHAAMPSLLIGGLGLGYTLRSALDRVPQAARIVVAELLPEIVAWNRSVLAPLARRPLDDPRVSVACTNVAALLRAAPSASFDAILLDTDNGPDAVMLAGNASLYAPEGLQLIRRALCPDGALAVWSADPSPGFEHRLQEAGFRWAAHAVPARGDPDDPLHTIYLAWQGLRPLRREAAVRGRPIARAPGRRWPTRP